MKMTTLDLAMENNLSIQNKRGNKCSFCFSCNLMLQKFPCTQIAVGRFWHPKYSRLSSRLENLGLTSQGAPEIVLRILPALTISGVECSVTTLISCETCKISKNILMLNVNLKISFTAKETPRIFMGDNKCF